MTVAPLEISAVEARRILQESQPGECLLLDCRTPEEYATARIQGALLIPMQELSQRVSEIDAWRPRQIVVHCHHGVRSLRVTHWLRDRGYENVSSMRGGIEAWSLEVDPQVPRY
jgi:rhodanese-related sulfurtransferase